VTKVIVDRKDAVKYIKNKYSVFISFDSFFKIKYGGIKNPSRYPILPLKTPIFIISKNE
jgi:hypothetical protein